MPGRKFSTTTSAWSSEAIDDAPAFGLLEVERDALLVAIRAEEVGALAADERRSPRACLIAVAGPLDLDDAGAHVGQHHRAVGAGQYSRQIEDGEAAQGAAGGMRAHLVSPNLNVRLASESVWKENDA